jgi:hypothetical protein
MSKVSLIIKALRLKKMPPDIEDIIFEFLGRKIVTAHWDVMFNIRHRWHEGFDIEDSWHTPFFLVHLMRQMKFIKAFKNKNFIFLIFKMLENNLNYSIKEEEDIIDTFGWSEYSKYSQNMYQLVLFFAQYIKGLGKKYKIFKFITYNPSGTPRCLTEEGEPKNIYLNYIIPQKFKIQLKLAENYIMPQAYQLELPDMLEFVDDGIVESYNIIKY